MLSSSTSAAATGGVSAGGSVNGGNGSGVARADSRTVLVVPMEVADAPEGRVPKRGSWVRELSICGREVSLNVTPRVRIAMLASVNLMIGGLGLAIGGLLENSGNGHFAVLAFYVSAVLSLLLFAAASLMSFSSHLSGIQYQDPEAGA